ncbi:MAG: GNAT family N-acetyltransferase, partial [Paracoccaceae bacterium]|nr:GNAT family N-acetyltransferase [Paracoccaceae bacterium]
MTVIIEPGNPRDPKSVALLSQSHALMERLYPPEDSYALSIDALSEAGILFFVAREYDVVLGCGALSLKDGYGEIKSVFTEPFARGQGVAEKIIKRIELEAKLMDLQILRLETGYELAAAVALYQKLGFRICEAFGEYETNKA